MENTILGGCMPINFDEKRDIIRMAADHKLSYHEAGSSETFTGNCINLSAAGIMFTADRQIPVGTQLEVNITPDYSVVNPFEALVEVVRCEANGSPDIYEIAGKITAVKS
jgi:hypothetical protein